MKRSLLILGTTLFLSSGHAAIKSPEKSIRDPKTFEKSAMQARLRLRFQPTLTATELEMLLDTIKNQKKQTPK